MGLPSFNISQLIQSFFEGTPSPARYTKGEGAVRYMDAGALNRSIDLPREKFSVALAFAAIALIVGIILAYNVFNATLYQSQRAAASVEENLSREVSYDFPVLSDYAGMDASSIKAALDESGLSLYTLSSDDEIAAGSLDVYKLPSDVSLEEAAALYLQGIGNLDAQDASLILNGSWRMQFDSSSGFNLSVHYTDFTSGNLDTAIESAIQAEGFDSASASELATDEAKNTYRTGTIEAAGVTYNWQVSAIAFSEVYDISGLPSTAIYVGIRLTAAA